LDRCKNLGGFVFPRQGLIFASQGQFSDNGCLSVASQAADGQGIRWVPPTVSRYNSCALGYWGGTKRL